MHSHIGLCFCVVRLGLAIDIAMKGVLVGDDHLCLMDRSRLRFAENVDTCTFGVEGATAESLLAKVRQLNFAPLDFVVVCVGGQDLSDGRDFADIRTDILVCYLFICVCIFYRRSAQECRVGKCRKLIFVCRLSWSS